MERKIIDLHVHSTYSDGSFTPKELVQEAIKQKLSAFALTDHDTIDGISQLQAEAAPYDIEIIPGVEVSCSNEGHEIHIVGLYINPTNNNFKSFLKNQIDETENRNF